MPIVGTELVSNTLVMRKFVIVQGITEFVDIDYCSFIYFGLLGSQTHMRCVSLPCRRATWPLRWLKVVDLEGKGMYADKHYALTAVLVILPARWADVALQPLVFLSVRQV